MEQRAPGHISCEVLAGRLGRLPAPRVKVIQGAFAKNCPFSLPFTPRPTSPSLFIFSAPLSSLLCPSLFVSPLFPSLSSSPPLPLLSPYSLCPVSYSFPFSFVPNCHCCYEFLCIVRCTIGYTRGNGRWARFGVPHHRRNLWTAAWTQSPIQGLFTTCLPCKQ